MADSIDKRLAPLRDAIDRVDAQLVELLNERARLAAEVGRVKGEVDSPVLRTEREAEVVRKVTGVSQGPLPAAALGNVFREIMSACRALERPLTVAFLGPAGTFSETAMHRQFGTSVTGLPCATLDEVFRATEAGSAEVGIVPLENSSEGAVSRTLDLLLATPLMLMAELTVTVDHNLLTRTGTMDGVRLDLRAFAGARPVRRMAGAALPGDRAACGGQQRRGRAAGGRRWVDRRGGR